MATLEDTRRLHDWALAEVLKRFPLSSELPPVSRAQLELDVCALSGSKMASFVVRSTVNVLIALNVLVWRGDGLVIAPEQARCMENLDHYSHSLFLLRRERQRLQREEQAMLRQLVMLNDPKRARMIHPQAEEEVEGSPAWKHLQKQDAVSRVRALQIQLHTRRGLLESTLVAHSATPGLLQMQLGPLGAQDPASKTTKRHLDLKPGFEVELKSQSVDFISFIANQFEPWTQSSSFSDHESRSTTPRVHTPRPVASPSPQSQPPSSQHSWPLVSPISALKLPQWRTVSQLELASLFASQEVERDCLTREALEEEAELDNPEFLLQRHETVLKGIRSEFEKLEEERKQKQREPSLKSNKTVVASSSRAPPPPPPLPAPQAPGATLTRSRRH
ncbi:hypothetical protein BASA81_001290 [Batrachochytrium salamandrivorans]|nr:hypothetical protein BASA81_001290 [Batrachochytrium salamandrivorans]